MAEPQMSKTCGFICPVCGCCDAETTGKDIIHILELACCECGWEFAVEMA